MITPKEAKDILIKEMAETTQPLEAFELAIKALDKYEIFKIEQRKLYRQCRYCINDTCMEQMGDNEDLTLEEFKELGTCLKAEKCPFSQYYKG